MTEKEAIEKATKLIRRFDNMRILGARGEWSGNARQGFMFNPQRGGGSVGGATPPEIRCPDDLIVFATVDFAGITMACGCVDISGITSGDSIIATPNSINGSIVVNTATFPPFFGDNPFLTYHLDQWQNSTDCSGDPDVSSTETPLAFLWCPEDGNGIYVFYSTGGGGQALFYARVTSLGTPFSNTLTCGNLFTPPDQTTISGFFGAPAAVIAEGGTVTLALS